MGEHLEIRRRCDLHFPAVVEYPDDGCGCPICTIEKCHEEAKARNRAWLIDALHRRVRIPKVPMRYRADRALGECWRDGFRHGLTALRAGVRVAEEMTRAEAER